MTTLVAIYNDDPDPLNDDPCGEPFYGLWLVDAEDDEHAEQLVQMWSKYYHHWYATDKHGDPPDFGHWCIENGIACVVVEPLKVRPHEP